jgi:hypothetical protein
MDWQTSIENFYNRSLRFYDERTVLKNQTELYILVMITVPLSLLLYLLFSRSKHKTLVDLGRGHKWLIK